LARDLEELVSLQIIDKNFRILQENTFIVFNGNVVDLSPYILETLTLVINIMIANPKKVFYLRGKHEDKEYWLNFGLKQELEIRMAHQPYKEGPAYEWMRQFFNTLPLALYLIEPAESIINVTRISPSNRKDPEIEETEYGDFFKTSDKTPDIFNLDNKKQSELKIDIKSIIRADERSSSYTPSKGLLNIEPDQGATSWTILSSPIRTNRTLYEFFYDSFVILTTAEKMNDWTISLYNRDVRDLVNFRKVMTYNLITGQEVSSTTQESAPKTTHDLVTENSTLKKAQEDLQHKLEECKKNSTSKNNEIVPQSTTPDSHVPENKTEASAPKKTKSDSIIVVGTLLDLSKYLKVESTFTQVGLELALNRENKNGGVHGRKIKLIVLDDEFDQDKALANVHMLLDKYKTSIILMPMGSNPLQGYLHLVEEKKVVVIFPSTGAVGIRDPKYTNLINFRPSYGAIVTAALKYTKDVLLAKKFAIFYVNDSSSSGVENHVKNADISSDDYLMVPYEPNERNFTHQAELIKNYNPDIVALLGTSRAAETLLQVIGAQNLINKHLVGTELGDQSFKAFLKDHGLSDRYIDTQNIPNPKTSTMEILKDYRDDLNDESKIDSYSAEAYISAAIFVDALRRIDGDITDESIIKVFENTKDYDYKGFKLNFDPTTREISEYVWLDNNKADWIPLKLQPYGAQAAKQNKLPLQETKDTQPTEKPKESQPATPPAEKKSITNSKEIVIGSTLDLSKSMKIVGEETKLGLSKAFDKINREGGINGQHIRLVILDDEYNATLAGKNVSNL